MRRFSLPPGYKNSPMQLLCLDTAGLGWIKVNAKELPRKREAIEIARHI